MDNSLDWVHVKDFYKQCFGIDGWVVELYAVLDILNLCASGASNESIVKFSDLDLEDVVEILMTTFHFPGWKEDLPVNPYKLFLDTNGDFDEFNKAMVGITAFEFDPIINLYQICKTMKEIEERIADEWI